MEDKNIRFIRLNEVRQITGLSRSSIYQFIAEGKFPSQVRIGTRAVAWVASEVYEWANIRILGSRTQQYQIQNDNHFVQVNLNE